MGNLNKQVLENSPNLKADEMNNTLMNEKKVMYKYDDIGDSSALL